MAIDTSYGMVRKFDDFLYTAIADAPELSTVTVSDTGATEVRANAEDGRIEISTGTSNDNDQAGISFNLNWIAGTESMYMEARIILSALTDNQYFVGWCDSLAETDETAFDNPADVLAIGTQSDAFGFLFCQDATTKTLFAVGAKTNAITVNSAISADFNPVASTFTTLGCSVSADRKTMIFYVDGNEVYRIDSPTTLIAAVALCPSVINYEQATALDIDVDYLYARKGRAST